MRSFSFEDLNVRGVRSIKPPQTWARLTIVIGTALLFTVAFHPIIDRVGIVGTALIAIPVALAGWYFGIAAGLVASLLGVVLVTSLLSFFKGSGWITWIVIGWPGDLMVVGAGLIAGYIHNGFVERTYMVKELSSRERSLTLLNMATKEILVRATNSDIYYRLISRLVNLFIADYGYFVHWDEEQWQATLLATTIPLTQSFSENVLDRDESALTMSVMQSGDILTLEDASGSSYTINPAQFKDYSLMAQSVLCIPLIAKEYKSGMAIIVFNTPHRFTAEELEYAKLAGSQLALALCSIEQELKIREQLKESNAVAGIERILSEVERVGIETVLQFIADSALGLIPKAKRVVLHLVDIEKQSLVPRAVAGFTSESRASLNMRLGEGVAGQVFVGGDVVVVADAQADPRFQGQDKPVGFRSLIVAPVRSGDSSMGTISIHSDQPNVFTLKDGRLLRELGILAAVAIGNANLLETTQQDLKEINALYHISRGLVASLDPDQLMREVVELLGKEFGYYYVQIFSVDPENGDLVLVQGSKEIVTQLKGDPYRFPAGTGVIGHVAETGEAFFTNDTEKVIFFARNPLLPNTQSELTVPIKIKDKVLGVLDIQQDAPAYFTPRHMHLINTAADQLAVALQQANLYAELQVSLDQEKATRSQLIQSERLAIVGRLLASVSHELNNPLQAIQNALFLLREEEELTSQGRQDLDIVLLEVERMTALLERLRTAYRPSQVEDFQDVRLNEIVEDVCTLTATHMRHKDISLKFNPDQELPTLQGVPDQIRQVVLNLFVNAMEAMESGGTLTVITQHLSRESRVLLSVTDTGAGIAAEILPHLFEPFVTDKETGTGLGLAITYDIVHSHGGDIQAENNLQGGATFKVWFPVNGEAKGQVK